MSVDLKKLLKEHGCKDISFIQETAVNDCSVSLMQLRDSLYLLGNILYEDTDKGVYVASIRSGFRNMNSAVVAMQLEGNRLVAAAYAKEGAVKQGIGEKALQKLTDAAHGKNVTSPRPKWLFPSILALIIVVAAISVGRSSLFAEKPEITPPEESAYIDEVELAIAETELYNDAVRAFNENVAAYNEASSLTSIDNIEGLPISLETLATVSENYDDVASVIQSGNSKEKITTDTATILEMAEQVSVMTSVLKQITAPSSEWVIERLKQIDNITGIQEVTEELNPDGLLGKDGGYSSCIYFTIAAAVPSEVPGNSIVEKGTDAGGAVEVYPTLDDANARVDYLAGFDGSVLYSGSYAVVGTMVIRTSYKLSNEQQIELTSTITQALTTTSAA